MNKLFVCFGLESLPISLSYKTENLEKNYTELYKTVASFFYAHAEFPFFFSFNGPQLSYYHKKHSEFLKIIHNMLNRKQTEIIGGGYWNPVFPLISPTDRSGQIENLTALIRSSVGKRPRGIMLCADTWDASIIASIQKHGMEYVFLDNASLPQSKQCFMPLVMSEINKTVNIVPVYSNMKPPFPENKENAKETFLQYFKDLQKKTSRTSVPSSVRYSYRMVTVVFSHDELQKLIENDLLLPLYEAATSLEDVSVSLPSVCLKTIPKIPCFIPSAINHDISEYASVPYTRTAQTRYNQVTIHDFFETYPHIKSLYDRMIFVSGLVNQCHGDKMRKNSAREKLWEAQAGDSFVCSNNGKFSEDGYRWRTYKLLTETEQFIREASNFEESVFALDYDSDGAAEYVLRMQPYTSYIHRIGGIVRSMCVMSNTGDYADNFSRDKKFDGTTDNWWRGFFVDHLYTKDEFSEYTKNASCTSGIFSDTEYDEMHFFGGRKELQLKASGEIATSSESGTHTTKVSLRKKYVVDSGGFAVQYILKNEGTEKIEAVFCSESNFAESNCANESKEKYSVVIVSGNEKIEIPSDKKISHETKTDVSALKISDVDTGVSFIFEPNENSSVLISKVKVTRPIAPSESAIIENAESETTNRKVIEEILVSSIFWNVSLEAGQETEHTINFGVLRQKRDSAKKRKNK